jgi:hypothetical protein
MVAAERDSNQLHCPDRTPLADFIELCSHECAYSTAELSVAFGQSALR